MPQRQTKNKPTASKQINKATNDQQQAINTKGQSSGGLGQNHNNCTTNNGTTCQPWDPIPTHHELCPPEIHPICGIDVPVHCHIAKPSISIEDLHESGIETAFCLIHTHHLTALTNCFATCNVNQPAIINLEQQPSIIDDPGLAASVVVSLALSLAVPPGQ